MTSYRMTPEALPIMNELPRGIKAGTNAEHAGPDGLALNWRTISTAPIDLDLELAVLDDEGEHALVFPCRRGITGWVKAKTGERVDVRPTHWREWKESGTSSVFFVMT